MTEMAAEDVRALLCAVCSSPLPPPTGRPGRPRKVCRDEDSPTPGGCARWRNMERTNSGRRVGVRAAYTVFPDGGFIIESGDGYRPLPSRSE